MNPAEREKRLAHLLRPIEWSWSSSIRARQNLVVERRRHVCLVIPFLNPEELARAHKWLSEEKHDGLWD